MSNQSRTSGDRPEEGVAGARSATLHHSSEVVRDSAEVKSRMAAFGGDGWVCLTDEVLRYDGAPIAGTVLNAELSDGEGVSLHVRQHRGGWQVTTLSEEAGGEHRYFEESYCSTEGNDRLLYHLFWQRRTVDGLDVWQPWVARFAGWRRDA